jgi:excisionase family DNA binding protein
MIQNIMSELVTRKEVADLVRVSTKTVQRAERRGELIPVKFNSRLVRYHRSDVDAWIAKAQAGTARP